MKFLIFDADQTLYRIARYDEAKQKKFTFLQENTGTDAKKLQNKWESVMDSIRESCTRDAVKRSREFSTKETLVYFGINEKKAEALTKQALEIFWSCVVANLEFDPQTKEMIKNLGKNYRLCVSSDEFRKNLEMKLNKVFGNWAEYFEFLVTADDTGELKPSSKFVEIPLKKLGAKPEEAAFIGDSWERDLAPAKKAGLTTILVAPEKEGHPDYWARSVKDVPVLRL